MDYVDYVDNVDDIFMIWNDSEDKLMDLLAYINTANPAIQFTQAHSLKSVNFLDVLVALSNDGTISTDLYTKPTDTSISSYEQLPS